MSWFWGSDSKSNGQPHSCQPQVSQGFPTPGVFDGDSSLTSRAPKRARDIDESTGDTLSPFSKCYKRPRLAETNTHHAPETPEMSPAREEPPNGPLDDVRDVIQHQFGVEILLKHNELRLIDQEMAKCQVALEQLRRCHLIPYPMECPTPTQMVNISKGDGPALRAGPDGSVPKWAPPFGVVDGPYARHYAKWLIPDPAFDGVEPEWRFTAQATASRVPYGNDSRASRHATGDPASAVKGRTNRSMSGLKLQSLASGYAQPKDKAGPCVLKRADGQTVKLVCLDCHRENFSSTQGFINHCRIAHKRDFKSHEEAAVQSGQPLESAASNNVTPVGSAAPSSNSVQAQPQSRAPVSPSVHPYARSDLSESEAYEALRGRIQDSLKLFRRGQLPGVHEIPRYADTPRDARVKKPKFESAETAPFLSRLLAQRNFEGDLREAVADAKAKVSLDEVMSDDELEDLATSDNEAPARSADALPRTPVVQRVPASTTRVSRNLDVTSVPVSGANHGGATVLSDEDMDLDANLSPTTLTSNNAPSLVSDDGEYDESDESSVSGASDGANSETVSDVAEISFEEDQEVGSLRRRTAVNTRSAKFDKDETKQVSFMRRLRDGDKERTRQRP